MKKPTVLLTAFDCFGGRRINSSERFIFSADVADIEEALGIHFERRIMPVDWARAPAVLIDTISKLHPEVVICFGEAPGPELRLETKAHNWSQGRIVDNAGIIKEGSRIMVGGPDSYNSRLPNESIQCALAREKISSSLSNDAGSFLCNEVFYRLLHFAKSNSWLRHAGFIHVPVDWDLMWRNRSGLVEHATKQVRSILQCVLRGSKIN